MHAKRLAIPDVWLLEPKIFSDERGFFFESFNQKIFADITQFTENFVQDNHSHSLRGVLRGMHYQLPPRAQGKLVRVAAGEVFDVAVDIRKNSPTFGHWLGEILSSENKRQMWIPAGFAHGFLTLSETADFLYKTTDTWSPEHERCIAWDDPEIGIQWPYDGKPILSAKDISQAKALSTADVF